MERPCLLISDVDNTLLGEEEATQHFARWLEERRQSDRPVGLALNSGRFCASLLDSVETTPLPCPDAIIGGVGTQIHFPPDWNAISQWPLPNPGWVPNAIRAEVISELGVISQEQEWQSDYKLSFYAHDLAPDRLATLRENLNSAGRAVEVVYSSQRDLDVLPAGVDKGTAAAFLAKLWEISPERVFVAGDSGNDLTMFQQGFRGIVVGNAHPELKRINSADIYHCKKPYAEGVIEGLEHWLDR